MTFSYTFLDARHLTGIAVWRSYDNSFNMAHFMRGLRQDWWPPDECVPQGKCTNDPNFQWHSIPQYNKLDQTTGRY